MRLLHTRTGEFRWVNNPQKVRFAILSHVWEQEGEQSYTDLLKIQEAIRTERASNSNTPENAVLSRVSSKIRDACACALTDGFEFIWIDSCCLDKTSSAELSEAINSMYTWYGLSTVCYAYLPDVHEVDEDPRGADSQFRRSVWFTRGWTLQELLAPKVVLFFSSDWHSIGAKQDLAEVVEEVTRIDRGILTGVDSVESVSVARRMSWASTRVTTRDEDEAYSLMGIFGVNMPTIYGEGRKAFFRLQQEILRDQSDQSIFVWDWHDNASRSSYHADNRHTLLASSPAAFLHSSNVRPITRQRFFSSFWWPDDAPSHTEGDRWFPPSTYETTPYGVRTRFPIIKLSPKPLGLRSSQSVTVGDGIEVAPLACEEENGMLALVLMHAPNQVDKKLDVRTIGASGSRVSHCQKHQYHPHIVLWPLGAHDDTPSRRLVRVVRIQSSWISTSYDPSTVYLVQNPLLLSVADNEDSEELTTSSGQDSSTPNYELTLPLDDASRLSELGYKPSLTQAPLIHDIAPRGASPPAYTLEISNGLHTLTFTFPQKQDTLYCLIPVPAVAASFSYPQVDAGRWQVSQDGSRLWKCFQLPASSPSASESESAEPDLEPGVAVIEAAPQIIELKLALNCESPGFSDHPARFAVSVDVRLVTLPKARPYPKKNDNTCAQFLGAVVLIVMVYAMIIGMTIGLSKIHH